MRLSDKTVVVTGAAMGIGRAIAERLAAEGAWVAVTDRDEETARQVAEAIQQRGGKALAAFLDVTRPDTIAAAMKQVLEARGRIDVWVNNAGVSTMNRFVDLTEEDWDFNMSVNAKGCSCVPSMQHARCWRKLPMPRAFAARSSTLPAWLASGEMHPFSPTTSPRSSLLSV